MSNSKTVQTPWLVKTYSAQLEQSASLLDSDISFLSGNYDSLRSDLTTETTQRQAGFSTNEARIEANAALINSLSASNVSGISALSARCDVLDYNIDEVLQGLMVEQNERIAGQNLIISIVSGISGVSADLNAEERARIAADTSLSHGLTSLDNKYETRTDNYQEWNSSYSTVTDNSANWNTAYTDFSQNSANYDSTYSTVLENSGTWGTSGIQSVYTDGTTVSGNGTSASKIGLIGTQYNLVAGANTSLTVDGNDLIIASTGGGSTSGPYLPLSGGTVSGTLRVSGSSYNDQFVGTRDDTAYSAYFGVGSDGRAFMKSSLDGRPELKLNSNGLIYAKDSGFSKLIPMYSANDVANMEAFGFDSNGSPVEVQSAGNYVSFVHPTTASGEIEITTLRGIGSKDNIPASTTAGTLWVVVSAVN